MSGREGGEYGEVCLDVLVPGDGVGVGYVRWVFFSGYGE